MGHTLSNEWQSRDIWDIEKLDPIDNHDNDDDEIDVHADDRRLSNRKKTGNVAREQQQ